MSQSSTEEHVAFLIKRITIEHKIVSFILKIRFLNYLIPSLNKMTKKLNRIVNKYASN